MQFCSFAVARAGQAPLEYGPSVRLHRPGTGCRAIMRSVQSKKSVTTPVRPVRKSAASTSKSKPAAKSASKSAPVRRKPARKKPAIEIPAILLEGDQPPVAAHSGPGERYAVGTAPSGPAGAESGEL